MSAPEGLLLDRAGQNLPLAELASLWPLGGWSSVSTVAQGKNEHLRVVAGDGVHYLRRSYRAKPSGELAGQLRLMRILCERGFPAPEVVPAANGADYVELFGRLWIATRGIAGTPFDDRSREHLWAMGRTLAHYHRVVADLPAAPAEPSVLAELRALGGERDLEPALRSRTAHIVGRLDGLLPHLPRVMVHGGARRGSFVFAGERVAGVLDFDSAHPDVRVLDLAVAIHDVGKVYTLPGSADHKVALDLDRATELLAAYSRDTPPTPPEFEALLLLLEAKRLKRGLGRRSRERNGETLSDNDYAKIQLEDHRLAWLDEHRHALASAFQQVLQRAGSPSG